MTVDEKLDLILDKVSSLETKVDSLENRVTALESEIHLTKQEVRSMRFSIENEIDKCISVLGEGYQMTYEKVDQMNLDSLHSHLRKLDMIYELQQSGIKDLRQRVG